MSTSSQETQKGRLLLLDIVKITLEHKHINC
nr:MAG TPA: hypothetical protein [Caudoviricetes sp.]